ncbi:MAG: hypothetical protein ACT4PL_05110 [Phycisphaerales bacterium]
MKTSLRTIGLLALAFSVCVGGAARGDGPEPYTRLREGDGGVVALEIASRSFRKVENGGEGWPRIRLVGAVHIGDSSYYGALQTLLDANALVLFEGVKPPGTGAIVEGLDDAAKGKATEKRGRFLLLVVEQFREKEGRFPKDFAELVREGDKRWRTVVEGCLMDAWGRGLVLSTVKKPADPESEFEEPEKYAAVVTSAGADGQVGTGDDVRAEGAPVVMGKKGAGAGNIQAQMAKALGLTYQLDAMDSGKKQWRSCDMDVEELQQKMEEAGADSSGLLKMLDGSSLMGRLAGWVLGMVGKNQQLSTMLKLMMVETLSRSEDLLSGPRGGAGGGGPLAGMQAMMKVILIDRNEVVVRDLRGVLEKERGLRDVAVFYGAGHMADLENRLVNDLGYVAEDTEWLSAIRVDPKDAGMSAAEVKALRERMKKMTEGMR